YLEPMLEGVAEDRLSPTPIGPRTVLSIERPRIHAANGHLKRTFDVVFSTITLMLVSPIMIATALAIKLEDGGPVFYKSERIGKKGEPYYVWKFRSMCLDAEDKIKDLIEANGGQSLLFKMKDDPRVTRVGKFIRKYSIDELPQFFNTLQGTMSVVGPRPQVQREVDEYDSDMYMRLEVPPGITGLWQVNGRSNLSPQLAQALDLYYVDNWSFLLDIRIICATLKAVLKSEGAY
ncbi:MAG: sugar transferase, partial [Corynebacterium sp.]|nr:sugar transferase [Corynebacterium sp.]